MTSVDLAPRDSLKAATREQVNKAPPSKPHKVTGALAIACTAIIQEGLDLEKAAKRAGMTTHKLRLALAKPHVINWMKSEREVFRAYVCAQNIHTLREVRDDKANKMARVQAVRTLEGMSDNEPGARGGMAQVAGFVIVLREGATQQAPLLDVTPVKPE